MIFVYRSRTDSFSTTSKTVMIPITKQRSKRGKTLRYTGTSKITQFTGRGRPDIEEYDIKVYRTPNVLFDYGHKYDVVTRYDFVFTLTHSVWSNDDIWLQTRCQSVHVDPFRPERKTNHVAYLDPATKFIDKLMSSGLSSDAGITFTVQVFWNPSMNRCFIAHSSYPIANIIVVSFADFMMKCAFTKVTRFVDNIIYQRIKPRLAKRP